MKAWVVEYKFPTDDAWEGTLTFHRTVEAAEAEVHALKVQYPDAETRITETFVFF